MTDDILVPLYNRSSDITGLNECHMKWWLGHLYPRSKDMVYFHVGTACHYGFEQNMLYDLSLEDTIDAATMEYQSLLTQTAAAGRKYEGTSARGKRTKDTALKDIKSMTEKWYHHVHPDGIARLKMFDRFDWPATMIEHTIHTYVLGVGAINTQVDAVFTETTTGRKEIWDWKTGGTAGKAKALQLQYYRYGLQLEGHIDPGQEGRVGGFVHCAFLDKPSGIQRVNEYLGDDIMQNWYMQTRLRKQQDPWYGPLCLQDWWCNYCVQREHCPQEGDGDYMDLAERLGRVRWLNEPRKEDDGRT